MLMLANTYMCNVDTFQLYYDNITNLYLSPYYLSLKHNTKAYKDKTLYYFNTLGYYLKNIQNKFLSALKFKNKIAGVEKKENVIYGIFKKIKSFFVDYIQLFIKFLLIALLVIFIIYITVYFTLKHYKIEVNFNNKSTVFNKSFNFFLNRAVTSNTPPKAKTIPEANSSRSLINMVTSSPQAVKNGLQRGLSMLNPLRIFSRGANKDEETFFDCQDSSPYSQNASLFGPDI